MNRALAPGGRRRRATSSADRLAPGYNRNFDRFKRYRARAVQSQLAGMLSTTDQEHEAAHSAVGLGVATEHDRADRDREAEHDRDQNVCPAVAERARLESPAFVGSECAAARLSLRGVEFTDCKLMGIDWTHVAPHPDVSFVECNLRYSSFVEASMRKAKFRKCVMDEANWVQVDLSGSVFEECRFSGTRFEGCNLERTKFPGCVDLLLDPSKNRVKGAAIPLQSAILLASSFGMRVLATSDGDE